MSREIESRQGTECRVVFLKTSLTPDVGFSWPKFWPFSKISEASSGKESSRGQMSRPGANPITFEFTTTTLVVIVPRLERLVPK
jgi:hypothetical protein